MSSHRVAWLFPGQGSQSVGMGKALHDASPAARRVFERADEALGTKLSRLCFEGPAEDLTLTENAQPAIVTTSIAALEALRESVGALPDPVVAAGHSLGEYSALVAAGALGLEDAVRLVRLRGRAMQQAVPPGIGAMAAVLGGSPEDIARLCDDAREGDVLAPANFNAPGQIVIAGHATAVARATELAKGRKLKAIALPVSAPFHCALMAPAARTVESELTRVEFAGPRFPVVANVDATPNSDAHRLRDLLTRQVDGAVLWEASVREIAAFEIAFALEFGPGKILAGLVKRIVPKLDVLGVGEPANVQAAATRMGG